jgi:hypothetical protein
VFEERLLGVGIGMIPELEDFLEEKHARRPVCLGWDSLEVEGLVELLYVTSLPLPALRCA